MLSGGALVSDSPATELVDVHVAGSALPQLLAVLLEGKG